MRAKKRYKPLWIYRYRSLLSLIAGIVVLVVSSGFFNQRGFEAKIANAKQSAVTKKGACNIKGNVSYYGDRKIYHVPGQQD